MSATESENSVFSRTPVNAMPAPTWHRLMVNSQVLVLPKHYEIDSEFELEVEGAKLADKDAFDSALAAFQEKLDGRKRSAKDTRAVVDAAEGKAEAGSLDVPALSSYQKNAVLEEVSGDVREAFETGVGSEAYSFLKSGNGHVALVAQKGTSSSATVRLLAKDATCSATCVDVVAEANSQIEVTLSYEAAGEGSGQVGCALRVFAGENAQVTVHSVQALGDAWTVFDDSGYVLDDNAKVAVTHRVLGAGTAFTGLSADLRGDKSSIEVSTRYIGASEELRDFNYSIKQRGLATESNLDANGVLAGSSKKTLRGTIDFVYGCKGSTGNERETVLLADEGVENKTVPVILCDEDDVMGNHGATIGHVRPEQHFYLACRGLSDKAIESLFSVAALEEAYMAFDDERIRHGVAKLAQARGVDAEDFIDGEEECE